MQNQALQANSHQSGNILFLVFIMIALFAALTMALMRGSRTGESALGSDKARLAATDLLEYTQQLKNAYKQLRINGCDHAQISFANNAVVNAQYLPDPASAPADKSCHLFDKNGGGVNYRDFTDYTTSDTGFSGLTSVLLSVDGIGTTAPEEILAVAVIRDEICKKINGMVNGSETIYSATIGARLNNANNLNSSTCADCKNKTVACISDPANLRPNLYVVIEAQ